MSVHDPHGDRVVTSVVVDIPGWDDPEGEVERPILFDGCPRCEEQAEDPFTTLDPPSQRALWLVMLAVEGAPLWRGTTSYASHAEAKAGRAFYRVAIMLDTHRVLPWSAPLGLGRTQ